MKNKQKNNRSKLCKNTFAEEHADHEAVADDRDGVEKKENPDQSETGILQHCELFTNLEIETKG